MHNIGLDSDFWIKLIVIIGSILLLFSVFNILMSKLLGVEKKKSFSYNHVNDLHKKLDWTLRIIYVLVMLFILAIISTQGTAMPMVFLISAAIFLVISETIRAFKEWKYASNPKDYILTLSQLGLAIIVFCSVIYYFEMIS